jgi:hypothetical protein
MATHEPMTAKNRCGSIGSPHKGYEIKLNITVEEAKTGASEIEKAK